MTSGKYFLIQIKTKLSVTFRNGFTISKKSVKMEKQEQNNKKAYEAPATTMVKVEPEETMCVVASGPKISIKKDTTIEVEEYTTIENDVTFK